MSQDKICLWTSNTKKFYKFYFYFFCDNGKIQQKGGELILKRNECILYIETIFVLFPPIVNISSSASLCILASESTGSMGWFHWLPCSVHLDSVTTIFIPSSLMCQNLSLLAFPIMTWWSRDSEVVLPAVGSHWLMSIQSQKMSTINPCISSDLGPHSCPTIVIFMLA